MWFLLTKNIRFWIFQSLKTFKAVHLKYQILDTFQKCFSGTYPCCRKNACLILFHIISLLKWIYFLFSLSNCCSLCLWLAWIFNICFCCEQHHYSCRGHKVTCYQVNMLKYKCSCKLVKPICVRCPLTLQKGCQTNNGNIKLEMYAGTMFSEVPENLVLTHY